MDEPTAEAMSLTVSVCSGLKQFIGDMGTTHRPIAIWASLFPFPQIFVGGFLAATRGVASPAALVFVTRVASFFIAGQVRALTSSHRAARAAVSSQWPWECNWVGENGRRCSMTHCALRGTGIAATTTLEDDRAHHAYTLSCHPSSLLPLARHHRLRDRSIHVPVHCLH